MGNFFNQMLLVLYLLIVKFLLKCRLCQKLILKMKYAFTVVDVRRPML
jgi:hypothetical protein